MAKFILSGIHNLSDLSFDFDFSGNKRPLLLNCRFDVLTGDAVKDNHFIQQCPLEFYDDYNNYAQEHYPMEGLTTFDDLAPLFAGPAKTESRLPVPVPVVPRFTVNPGGYCRTDTNEYIDLTSLKINAYREYTGKGSVRQVNRLEIAATENDHDIQFRIYHGDELVVTKDVSLYRYNRDKNDRIELYLTISPGEGFFLQPMLDQDLDIVQGFRDIATYLWEAFSERRERIAIPLNDRAAFRLFCDNGPVELVDYSYPDPADQEALEAAHGSYSFQTFYAPDTFPVKNGVPHSSLRLTVISEEKSFAAPGKNRQMKMVMDDLFPLYNPDNKPGTVIEWTVMQQEDVHHKIDANGLFTAGNEKGEDGQSLPCRVAATLIINLEMVWPDDWPKLGQGRYDLGWTDDAAGQQAVWLLHNLLNTLPQTVISLLKETTFVRREYESQFAEYTALTDVAVIPDRLISGTDPVKLAYQFMRMIGRAALAGKSGINFKENFSQVAIIWQKCQEAEVSRLQNVPSLIAGIIPVQGAVDCVVASMIEWMVKSISHHWDTMADYCKLTNWWMNNYSPFLDIPMIGWVARLLFRLQTPHYPYIAISGIDYFYRMLGVFNYDAQATEWKKAGMANAMAIIGPDHDFGEAFAQQVFTLEVPAQSGIDSQEINAERKQFLREQYLGNDWEAITPEKIRSMNAFNTAGEPKLIQAATENTAAAQAYSVSGMRLNRRSLDYTNDLQQRALEDVYYGMKYRMREWDNGYKELFETYRKTLHALEYPLSEQPTAMELVQKLSIHGDGLRQYNSGQTVNPGDVLISFEPQQDYPLLPWLVLEVSEEHKVTKVCGALSADLNGPERSLELSVASVRYIWHPDTKARDWHKEARSTHYPELNETMRSLISLWGTTVDEVSHESFDRIGSFFKTWMRLSKLGDPDYTFEFGYDYTCICNYLYTHGTGLTWYHQDMPLEPGDIVIPFHQNTIGIVTRVNENGWPVDVLYGGEWETGELGEKPESIIHLHSIDVNDIRYCWKPDAAPKQWTNR